MLAQISYIPIITRLSMGKRPFSRKNCNFFCKKVAFSGKRRKMFYSNKVIVNKDFETSVKNLRAMGDGASVTRGLQQASANGLSVANSILSKLNK